MANIPPKKQIPADANRTAQAGAQGSTPSPATPPASEAPPAPSEAQPEANPALRMGTSADGANGTAPVAGVAPLNEGVPPSSEAAINVAPPIIKMILPESATKEEVAEMVKAAAVTELLRIPVAAEDPIEQAHKLLDEARKLLDTKPVVKFVQTTKRVLFPPVEMEDGGISLRLNDATFGELRIPENTSIEARFGYSVEIPKGWVGEVTVAGLVGQRVLCGVLVGQGVAELRLRLQTNNPHLAAIRAGEEVAQLHLRKVQNVAMSYENPFDT